MFCRCSVGPVGRVLRAFCRCSVGVSAAILPGCSTGARRRSGGGSVGGVSGVLGFPI